MRLTNVVVQGKLDHTVDLQTLANALTNVRYDPCVLVNSCGIIEKLVDIAKCLQVEQYSVTVNALLSKRESRD